MKLSPQELTAKQTRIVWNKFDSFDISELKEMLNLAGIKTDGITQRKYLIRNCVSNWFHGSVPNFVELDWLYNSNGE